MNQTICPIFTSLGKPFERGVRFGAFAKELIRSGVRHYVEMWEQNTGRSSAELFELAKQFEPVILDYDVRLMQEIAGVSNGAGIPLHEILMLNARYEIMLMAFFGGGAAELPTDGCTSFAISSQATSDRHTYVAQNWDLTKEAGKRCIILDIQQDDGPNIVTHTEAGLLAHKGMNSAGLGICINSIGTQHDVFAPKVPVFAMARAILNATTIDEAQRAVERADRTASVNITIGCEDGSVACLEITPVDVERIEPQDGRVAHANVLCGDVAERNLKDTLAERLPVFVERSKRAQQLVADASIDLGKVQSMLRDRANTPESICRHLDDQPLEAPQGLKMETLASVIFDLTERKFWLAEGPPDRCDYKQLDFSSLGRGD